MTVTNVIPRLERMLNPRVVAVVGDKAPAYQWLNNMKTFGGRLYSVQIDPKEIPGIEAMGIPNYTSLLDVPDEIDYVLVAVPRAVAPRILADCIKKGVGGAGFYTSGFAETTEEEGVRLQQMLTEMARQADFPMIGPNCMGLYNRRLGIRNGGEQPAGDSGNVGFISQSGTHCIGFSMLGAHNGIRCSKAISFGNAIVLDVSDYLEYLAQDPETEVIGMYVEGVKDGRRFFQVLREAAARKPVVVWKGGQTEAGGRAIYSHTASLAAPAAVWDSMMRQCGAITVDSIDEMIDVMKALQYVKPGTGRRVALVAMTGGQSVVITDAFAKAGLEVPILSDESYDKLAPFFTIIGGSYRNPMDSAWTIGPRGNPENLERLLQIVGEDGNIDVVVLELGLGILGRFWQQDPTVMERTLTTLSRYQAQLDKPFITIMHSGHMEAVAAEARSKVTEQGIPVFPSFQRGAAALAKVINYRRFRAGLDG